MKVVHFTQGDEEWHTWRKGGIGASDISVIMGSNPYKTPLQLWETKCGYREEDEINVAMQHGMLNEEHVRKMVEEQQMLKLKPLCVEDTEKSHFKASLDGWDEDHKVLVEIKCPISEKILDAAHLKQTVPSYWYDQMQWQIMLTNPQRAILVLWDYRNKGLIYIEMYGSPHRIEEMRKKGDSFWHSVQIGKAPEPQKGDYISLEDDQLHELLEEYDSLREQSTGYSNRAKEVKKLIEEFGNGYNFKAYGYTVTKVNASKSYDLEKMRVDGIDIDKYLKPSQSNGYYKIFKSKR